MSHTELRTSVCRIVGELRRLERLGVDRRQLDKVVREVIFNLFEGGEPAKWSYERPHSAAARALHHQCLELGQRFRGSRKGPWQVTYDHATPLAAIRPQIMEVADDPERLLGLLDRCVRGVIITIEENDMLTGAGLRSRMPAGATLETLAARYDVVNIAFEPADLERLTNWRPD